ncbi:MAG: hypothetical protein P9L99_03690 [Candidatus Lernaella stagnicola]|nr:hypothetical protein [Candidatus Lernaella stagnicola]
MEVRINVSDTVKTLLEKGVRIVNPLMVEISEDIDPDRISGDGVVLYPGTRLCGATTAICAGAQLGYEAPVVVEDCQIGPDVKLKGGYFQKATFLRGANMCMGAHVREGCLLEEEAGGAHTVGIKQTILFPFVTLGSLINFCDCLMAGGTSRKNHSEVGSSFIHFNFTPEADKTTASLLGDVPRGVMLRQPPIFLGGQGGIVGPVHMGFGTVSAAGSVLRHDVPEDNQLVVEGLPRSVRKPFMPRRYPTLARVLANNVLYVANLLALTEWYRSVRRDFFSRAPLGSLLYEGALDKLARAKQERLKRLEAMADKMSDSIAADEDDAAAKRQFHEGYAELAAVFSAGFEQNTDAAKRDEFLAACRGAASDDYVTAIQSLDEKTVATGTAWLQSIVDEVMEAAWQILPAFRPRT